MWVRVMEWMLADDEPSKPEAGSLLRSVGVRVRGVLTAADVASPDGVVEVLATGVAEQRRVGYALTGIASDPRDVRIRTQRRGRGVPAGAEFVLTVGAYRYQVQFNGCAADVVANSHVTVTGELELVGEYEWAAFELPDTRADWLVTGVDDVDGGDVLVELAPPRAR